MNELELPSVVTRTGSIGRLLVTREGRGVHWGTAFVVAERRVLTALHVIADLAAAGAPLRGDLLQFQLAGESYGATLLRRDVASDWALLEVDRSLDAAPIPLRAVGDEAATFSTWGFASQVAESGATFPGRIVNREHRIREAPAYELKADSANNVAVQGLSGAPCVVNGAAVGLMRSAVLNGKHPGATVVGGILFATPIEAVIEACRDEIPPVPDFPDLPPLPAVDPLPKAPFLYLNAYDAEHAELYFGRTAKVYELYRAVTSSLAKLVLLVGASGVGKSSLLQAGLAPRLRPRWTVHLLRPSAGTPLVETVTVALGGDDALPALWEARGTAGPLLVVLDQLEERYAAAGIKKADAEVTELLAAIPNGCKLVLGFREELHITLTRLLENLEVPTTRVDVQRMTKADIIEAITGIEREKRLGNKYHLTVEQDLPERIADDLLGDPESSIAPSLQVLLTKLYRVATLANFDAPCFSKSLYGHARRARYLDEFLDDRLTAAADTFRVEAEAGLIHDVLAYHVERPGRALLRTHEDRHLAYGERANAVERIVGWLYGEGGLLITRGDDVNRPTTRLVHDTLVPLVLEVCANSRRPAQVARRLLDHRLSVGQDVLPKANAGDWHELNAGVSWTRTDARERKYVDDCQKAARRVGLRRVLAWVAMMAVVIGGATLIYAWRRDRAEAAAERRRATAERLDNALRAFIASHRDFEQGRRAEAARAAGDAIRLAEGSPRRRIYELWLFHLARTMPEWSLRVGGGDTTATEDGFLIASNDGKSQVWDIEAGALLYDDRPLGKLRGHRPGARALYSVDETGDGVTVTVIEAGKDVERLVIAAPPAGDDVENAEHEAVGASADGRWIVLTQRRIAAADDWSHTWWAFDRERGAAVVVASAQIGAVALEARPPVVITARGPIVCRATIEPAPKQTCETVNAGAIDDLRASPDGTVVAITEASSATGTPRVGLWRGGATVTWRASEADAPLRLVGVTGAHGGVVAYESLGTNGRGLRLALHDRDVELTTPEGGALFDLPDPGAARFRADDFTAIVANGSDRWVGRWSLSDALPAFMAPLATGDVALSADAGHVYISRGDVAEQYRLPGAAPPAPRPPVPWRIAAPVFSSDCGRMSWLPEPHVWQRIPTTLATTDLSSRMTRLGAPWAGDNDIDIGGDDADAPTVLMAADGTTVALLERTRVAVGRAVDLLRTIDIGGDYTWRTGALDGDGRHLVLLGRSGGAREPVVARIDVATGMPTICALATSARWIGIDRLGTAYVTEEPAGDGKFWRQLHSVDDCRPLGSAIAPVSASETFRSRLSQWPEPLRDLGRLESASVVLKPPLVASTTDSDPILSPDGTMEWTNGKLRDVATDELLATLEGPHACVASDGTVTVVTPTGDVFTRRLPDAVPYWSELVQALSGTGGATGAPIPQGEPLTGNEWLEAQRRLRAALRGAAAAGDVDAAGLLESLGILDVPPVPLHSIELPAHWPG